MKEGWKMVKLGEVCEKTKNIKWQDVATEEIYRYIDLTSVDRETSSILETQSVSSNNAPSRAKQIVSKGDILFATTRPTLKRVCIIPDRFEGDICSTGFCVLRPKNAVLSNWIYYALKDDSFMTYITPLQKGASYPAVTDNDVKNYVVPLPPFEEQHRIVGILDAAFAKIDALKKNAEENLKNAKALFQQVLAQELKPKDGGDYRKLDSLYLIKTGKLNSNQAVKNGKYPFFTCSREIFAINEYAFDCEAVLLAGNNASGDFNVKHYKGKFNAYQRTYVIQPKTDLAGCRLLYYVLLLYLSELKSLSLGANTKFLKIGMIENIKVPILNSNEHRIVRTLDTLSEKCRRLEEVAQQTIRECDALKQSILRQAFSGEL